MGTFFRWLVYGFLIGIAFQLVRALVPILSCLSWFFTILAAILVFGILMMWVVQPTLFYLLVVVIALTYVAVKRLTRNREEKELARLLDDQQMTVEELRLHLDPERQEPQPPSWREY